MSCDCQNENSHDALQYLPQQLMGAPAESLNFYIQGVRTGLAIRAGETQKWTRLAVIMALTFGTLTFLRHWNE